MAVTQNTYTGNGATVLYSFTFPYLETTDVKVTINGTPTTAYTFANATTIQFNTAPANGAAIRIYRDTDDASLAATFYSGSAIRAQDLNDNFTQNLYVTQEVNNNSVNIDGSNPMVGPLNMNGFQIDNLAEPTTDSDAATKKYIDDRYGNLSIPGHTRWRKVATASQTTFSGTGDYGGVLAYSPTREQVYINGALQQRGVDYAADNGTSVIFTVGLTVGDVVDIICVNNLTNSAVSNAANITYSGQFTGQTARTVAAKLTDVVSVKDFGAVGDGVTDDTAAIQAALNSLTGLGGKVTLPTGKYKLTSTIEIPAYVTLEGVGRADGSSTAYAARLQMAHAGRGVKLAGTKAAIANLTIRYTATATSDEAVYAENVADPNINSVYIVGAYNGVTLISCNAPVVQSCDVVNCLGVYSYKVQGDAVLGNADSFLLNNVSGGFTGSAPAGFTHLVIDNYTNSGKLRGYRFVRGDFGIKVQGTIDGPDDIWIDGGGCDNQNVNGYRFTTGQQIYLNDAWVGQAGETGIVFSSTFVGNASIVSPRVRGSGQHGIQIDGGKCIHIVNPLVGQNSTTASNTYSGIAVSGAVEKLSIIGGTCGTLESGGSNAQKEGINLADANINYATITGVNLVGNVTRALTTSASTKDIFVNNCPGYDQIDGYMTLRLTGAVSNGTYNLDLLANKKILIKSVARVLSAGTCSIRLFDNGGSGMTASVSTTTTATNTNLSSPVTVDATGGVRQLTVTVTSASAASDLLVTFGYQQLVVNG